MKITLRNNRYAIAMMACFTIIMFLTALLTDGTCDEGDSIYHYLFARYSWIHHENFFNHWAKPFYVLIMSPFAHFGFIGAKLGNCLFSCVSVWFTYLIAKELKFKYALAVFPVALFFKTFMTVTFSGLTEPLSNMMMSIALYLAFRRKFMWAALIFSFLPFVRSEGLFLCGVFALFLAWKKQWKILPLLLAGHIIYAIAGFHIYHDPLWVFNKIPYAHAGTHYGHGDWPYYAKHMREIIGSVNYILFCLGLLFCITIIVFDLYRRKLDEQHINLAFLMLIFIVFFAMHSAFWALGIFGSFGLVRVFIAIASVMMIIVLYGIEVISSLIYKWFPGAIAPVFAITLAAYSILAFGGFHNSYSRESDFGLHADQRCDKRAAEFIRSRYPELHSYHLYFDATYLSEVMNIDIFGDPNYSENSDRTSKERYPPKSIVIWDDWYTQFEHGAHLDNLKANSSITEVKDFEDKMPWGEIRRVVVFVSKE